MALKKLVKVLMCVRYCSGEVWKLGISIEYCTRLSSAVEILFNKFLLHMRNILISKIKCDVASHNLEIEPSLNTKFINLILWGLFSKILKI